VNRLVSINIHTWIQDLASQHQNSGVPLPKLCKVSLDIDTVKPVLFACPLFREFREPGKFTNITGRKNLNTVAFQYSRKQKRQNYGVQNNYIDSNAKIKGGQN